MGTRGAAGFRVDGVDKIAYNQFDSYPDGLGEVILEDLRGLLRKKGVDWLAKKARKIRLVNESDRPSDDDQRRLVKFLDRGVSSGLPSEWYALLRQAQPSNGIKPMLDAGVMIDSHRFLADSLFCEWAYVVNLDEEKFEIYKGFQKKGRAKGRYAGMPSARPDMEYGPVTLKKTWAFKDVRNWRRKGWAEFLVPVSGE